MASEFKYCAFISYSHRDNRKGGNLWGDWLHDAVENFKVPAELVGKSGRYTEPVPARLYPAFQDEKELPTNADLGLAIQEGLEQSRYLVVICSPRSAKSVYVNQEVLEFKRLGRSNRILAIIVEGEPNASEPGSSFNAALECFPEALRHPLDANGELDLTRRAEPIAADVRAADGKEASLTDKVHQPVLEREKLRVLAGLLGIGFDELVQRDKERQLRAARRRKILVAGVATLAAAVVVAGALAFTQRKEAIQRAEEILTGKLASQSELLFSADGACSGGNQGAAEIELAALLATQSMRQQPTFDNDHMLRRELDLLPGVLWAKNHEDAVNSVAFSPDGKWLATGS